MCVQYVCAQGSGGEEEFWWGAPLGLPMVQYTCACAVLCAAVLLVSEVSLMKIENHSINTFTKSEINP